MHEIVKKEKVFLVVVVTPGESWSKEALTAEFESLALSTGVIVEGLISVNLRQPNAALYIGKGKAAELAEEIKHTEAEVVIFDNNLTATQQRNLEDLLGIKTIDRTQLILDIFAKHAHTQEGILQVELAQLEYLLPRLRGKGIELSRLGGGIGTKGPGEKKLEVDRRKISERIGQLKKDLKSVRQHRDVRRKKREKSCLGSCSLVGYTNAGKTTLFNALTKSGQTTSSDLFTTLDTVSRMLSLGNNLEVILSDTVGFIYKLPHNLIEAFKATLEELNYADLLFHVIDASNKCRDRLKESVDLILKELGLEGKTIISVFNKIDGLSLQELNCLKEKYPQGIFISAAKREGLENLESVIHELSLKDMIKVEIKVPFSHMDIASYLHNNYEILKITYQEQEAVYWVRIKKQGLEYIKKQGLEVKGI